MGGEFRMKQVGRHGMIYGLGILLNRAVAFIMLPVYTRFLTTADYGVLQLITMTIEVVTIFAGSRLHQGIFRYYHKAEDDDGRRAVLSTSLIVITISYVAAAATMYALSGWLSQLVFGTAEHELLFRLAAAHLGFDSLILVPFAYLRVTNRSTTFVILNAIKLTLQLSLNIVFVVVLHMGAKGVMISGLIAAAIAGTALGAFFFKEVGFHFSRSAARDLIRFGLPFVATQCATFFTTYADRYFLQIESDASTVGVYALAYQFGFLLPTLGYFPFSRVWDPTRFEIAKRDDKDELFSRGFVYCNMLLLSVALAIVLYVEDFLRIVSAPEFHPAYHVVPVVCVAYILQSWTNFQNVGILIREKTEMITMANFVAAGVAFVGYVTLIPRMLGLGAAIATVAAFLVRHLIIYGISQKMWPVKYQWGPVVRLAVLVTATFLLAEQIPNPNPWTSIVVRTMFFLGYLVSMWFLVLTDDDRASAISMLRKLTERLRTRRTMLRGSGGTGS